MITHIFKSPLPSFTYFFKDGMTAVFMGGRFQTDNERLAKEMKEEVGQEGVHKSRHPYIYIDPEDKEIDSEALTPMEKIRLEAKEDARRELLAGQAAERARAMDAAANTSKSDRGDFASSVVTTSTLAKGSAMESTGDMSAALAGVNGDRPAASGIIGTQSVSPEALNTVTPPANANIVTSPTATSPNSSMAAKIANLKKS